MRPEFSGGFRYGKDGDGDGDGGDDNDDLWTRSVQKGDSEPMFARGHLETPHRCAQFCVCAIHCRVVIADQQCDRPKLHRDAMTGLGPEPS